MKLTLTLILAATLVVNAQGPPKQGSALLKTDLMVVLAHPDDETGMAATLATYAHGQDKMIANVYCTRGEGGGNMVGTHWGPSLGVLREVELKQCLDILGVKHCFFLQQVDWAYTESAAMTLQKWNREAALGDLVRLIRALRPEIMVTMNPFPRPGQHGHHQAAGILAVEAYTAAADPGQFPQQLKREGLTTWQTRKLYFRGDSVGPVAKIDAGVAMPNGKTGHAIAAEALSNHRSQGFGRFQRATLGRPPESFGLVKTVIAVDAEETDLFAGLPIPEDKQVAPIEAPLSKARVITMSFEQRPAVTQFMQWAQRQKITHLVAKTPSDLPITVGEEPKEVQLTVGNSTDQNRAVDVNLKGPDGWLIDPPKVSLNLAAHSQSTTPIKVTASKDTAEDAIIVAQADDHRAQLTLHPVPLAVVTQSTPSVSFDGDAVWENAAAIAITSDQLVQGKTASAQDSSGAFRLLSDASNLYVEVDVLDDQVVSNIAPNDIRGHWRTDAVEICVDPIGGSEHTLTCFKVGIFPFDTTGAVRAARDADAMQGPIEETAPGMTLVSERTDRGYRLRTAIPWSEIGLTSGPQSSQEMGFNIILYDGDKLDAAVGENINKSRLAWAPRRGVQGRPEDWGRIRLR